MRAFRRAIVVLITFHLRICVTQTSVSAESNITTIGPYEIDYCIANIAGPINPQVEYLRVFLPIFRSLLFNLLQDLDRGTYSQHGYTAFFKTDDSVQAVRQIFDNIIDGSKILTGPWDRFTKNYTSPPEWKPPLIACVNPGEPDTILAQERCEEHSNTTSSVVASVMKNSGIILICPVFFKLPRLARRPGCPVVDPATNKFVNNGLDFAFTQYAVLVHEMVHVYNTGASLEEEIYNIQEAVDLDPKSSLENAQNFALYAAGKIAERGLVS